MSLKLHIFNPEGLRLSDKRPAMVFFHGGGWSGGEPSKLYPQAKYLASRGMVAISAEYRVRKRNNSTPRESVMDAADIAVPNDSKTNHIVFEVSFAHARNSILPP